MFLALLGNLFNRLILNIIIRNGSAALKNGAADFLRQLPNDFNW